MYLCPAVSGTWSNNTKLSLQKLFLLLAHNTKNFNPCGCSAFSLFPAGSDSSGNTNHEEFLHRNAFSSQAKACAGRTNTGGSGTCHTV